MDKSNYLSSNIKYLRTINHKTLDDIAKYMDKSSVTIYYWETGQREMYAMDLWNIANYFNVDIDDMVYKDLRTTNSELDMKLNGKLSTLTDEQKQKVIDMIDIIK